MIRPGSDSMGARVWARARNGAGTAIPAFSLVRVTGADLDGTLILASPDAISQGGLWATGATPIPATSGKGVVTRATPCWVAYDAADGTPAAGEDWGSESGSFLLHKDRLGFRILGGIQGGVTLGFFFDGVTRFRKLLTDQEFTLGSDDSINTSTISFGHDYDSGVQTLAYFRLAAPFTFDASSTRLIVMPKTASGGTATYATWDVNNTGVPFPGSFNNNFFARIHIVTAAFDEATITFATKPADQTFAPDTLTVVPRVAVADQKIGRAVISTLSAEFSSPFPTIHGIVMLTDVPGTAPSQGYVRFTFAQAPPELGIYVLNDFLP